MGDRLQVVLGPAAEGPLVAGVPAALRAAQRIAEDTAPDRILLVAADPAFARRWAAQLAGIPGARVDCVAGPEVRGRLEAGVPLLSVSAAGLAAAGALAGFLAKARAGGKAARWSRQGEVLAAYQPTPDSYAAQPNGALDVPARPDDWLALTGPESVRRAEAELFASLVKDTDGYIARFDRRISVALSRLLLRTPVTPNHVTSASLVLGLIGAALLAFGSYASQLFGAFLLWFCCILDGCDGEVARLKLLCSPSGAVYDLGADHIAHLAIFVAIPFGVHAANPQARVLLPGLLMVSGLACCMFTIWWLILRREEKNPGPMRLFFERVASRDYVYVIFFLVLIRKLHWWLWAAAFGAHLFNLILWAMFLRERRLGKA